MPTPPLSDEDKAKLSEIYNDPASQGSLGGVQRLFQAAKASGLPNITKAQVQEWVTSHPTYTRYRNQRVHFPRRQVQAFDIDWLWEVDLAEMIPLWHANGGVRYLLVQVDVLTKLAHVVPMHDKKIETVIEAFKKLFTQAGKVPKYLSSDRGSEFTAKEAVDLFKSRGITAYTMLNPETGAPNVERLIRTLKGRLYRYMDLNKTKRYIDVLPQIVDAYNRSRHSTIGMAPADVRPQDVERIRERVYYRGSRLAKQRQSRHFKYKFEMWQLVRVYLKRPTFHRGFKQQFSNEIFVICRRLNTLPPSYRLCPLLLSDNGLPRPQQFVEIEGSYYEQELIPVSLTSKPPDPAAPAVKVQSAPPPPESTQPTAATGEESDWEDEEKAKEESDWEDEETEEKAKEELPVPAPPPRPPPPQRPYLPRQTKGPRR